MGVALGGYRRLEGSLAITKVGSGRWGQTSSVDRQVAYPDNYPEVVCTVRNQAEDRPQLLTDTVNIIHHDVFLHRRSS